MGATVTTQDFTGHDRVEFRSKVHRCLDVVARMLATSRFHFDRPMTGTEIEVSLIHADGSPALLNDQVLAAVDDPLFTMELGRFNIEMNVRPRTLFGDSAADLEGSLRAQLNLADARAGEIGAGLILVGMLPTLPLDRMDTSIISDNPRYALLDEQLLRLRGEDLHIDIHGVENLEFWSPTIAPEAACTSVQFHLQVDPEAFPAYWNAAQVLAGVQVATGANSPYFGGRELWRESRVPVFTQATDTRSMELMAQGVRPRVWFGERYITSVFDLFEENIRFFPPLLPIVSEEEPEEILAAGGVPQLPELRLLNGTVWRWNRPVYDVVGDLPHIRLENRVLPSGPSVVDIMANAAFYYGCLLGLATMDRPLWSQLSFATAEHNFREAARYGIDATQYWPGMGQVPVSELVVRRLVPLAHDALTRWGVDTEVADRLLGIIEQRCVTGRNGAQWQVDCVGAHERRGLDRAEALRRMTLDYVERMHSNDPVHTWSLP